MLSPDQAAELLNVNPTTIRRWLRNGTLEGERYLRWWLVDEEKVLDLLARSRPEWRSLGLTGALLRAVAYHEAGHAVADWVTGNEFAYVTIVPAGRYLGCVSYTPDPLDAPWRIAQEEAFEFMARMLVDGEDVDIAEGQRLMAKYLEAIGEERAVPEREAFDDPIETEKAVAASLAGAMAEKRITGVYNAGGARFDRAYALGRTFLLMESQGTLNTEAVEEFWGRASVRASDIVCTNWLELSALARELLKHGQLEGQAAVAVFEETRRKISRPNGAAGADA